MYEEKLNDFILYLRFEKRYSAHTIGAYQSDLLQFKSYLDETFSVIELSAINHFQIRSWLSTFKEIHPKGAQDHTARTINRKMSSLNSFYKYLMQHGVVQKNPVKTLHAQRLPERLPVYLKEKETEVLLNDLQFPEGFEGMTERLVCELLYTTGIRRNELQLLKEQDIEWSLNQIRVLGKGNKERLIPVSGALLDSIRDYLAEKKLQENSNSVYLFNLPSGEPLYAMFIYRAVKKYLTLVTTLHKKSPHVMRHTFATHLLNNGANIQAIKDLLGHSSLAATQIYTHNNIDKLKQIHRQNHPRG